MAALFAVHPLHVESVAWIAERKDLLSGCMGLLSLIFYTRYAQNRAMASQPLAASGVAPGSRSGRIDYALALFFLALGLMSKAMLVTWPFVMLLLDYWPLNRLRTDAGAQPAFRLAGRLVPKRLIFEKLPLFGLAAASSVATFFAQAEAISLNDPISLQLRVGNALISYVTYLGQMFWPSGLAVLYPFPANGWPLWEMILASVFLLFVTTGVFVLRKPHPYLLAGWLWYLVMLVPVIGIVQVGLQARADRYTYLPQIGLYLMLTWSVADLCAGWRHRRVVLGGISMIILAALIFCARVQTSYWWDDESLWTHTLACTSDNAIAHLNLGNALLQEERVDEAIVHYQQALQIKPDFAQAHYDLGNAFFQKGRTDEAIVHYQQALKIKPDYLKARLNLGNALLQEGRVDEAIAHYQQALQINPDYMDAQNGLAWVLATTPQASLRNGRRAVELAQQANQLAGGQDPMILRTLAAACAEAGRFDDAVRNAQRAMELARAAGQPDLVDLLNGELRLYETGLPFHEQDK